MRSSNIAKGKNDTEYFNKTYDENFIIDFISYVLDPTKNGIGIEPLSKFIEDYSEEATKILQNITTLGKKDIEITREYSFSNGRWIDYRDREQNTFCLIK